MIPCSIFKKYIVSSTEDKKRTMSKALRCEEMFDNNAWCTRQIYIVKTNYIKTTNSFSCTKDIHFGLPCNNSYNLLSGLDEEDEEDEHENILCTQPIYSEKVTILKRVSVIHHLMCMESQVWFTMFGQNKNKGFQESQNNGEIVYMYVDCKLEAKILYSVIKCTHTSLLPDLKTEKEFILFINLIDKYELESIKKMTIKNLTALPDGVTNGIILFNITLIETFMDSPSPFIQELVHSAIENCLKLVSQDNRFDFEFVCPILKERFICSLLKLFTPLDNFLHDVRLMKLQSPYFEALMKHDNLAAINESTILWCCIKYLETGCNRDKSIDSTLSCVRFHLLSPIELVYFSTEFRPEVYDYTEHSYSIESRIKHYVRLRIQEVMYNQMLPDWNPEKIVKTNTRTKLSDTKLVELYSMDFTFKIPMESLDQAEDGKNLDVVSVETYTRGGWNWSLSMKRNSGLPDSCNEGNVGIFFNYQPIEHVRGFKYKTHILASFIIEMNTGLKVKTISEVTDPPKMITIKCCERVGWPKFCNTRWSNLLNSRSIDSDHVAHARLVIFPIGLVS